MGLLDGMLGNLIGGEMGSVVNSLLNGQGGISGLVSSLERGGLADIVQSWVGTGANLPVSPDQLHKALGPQMVQQLAQQAGMNPQDIIQQLANVLPGFVDKMTPGGFLPK
ncbi:MAG: DUF937 domain-containing protein [Acidobacteria bacterium]|nr:DUF937 domain-containing protein [Acidobacteriota bacterium]